MTTNLDALVEELRESVGDSFTLDPTYDLRQEAATTLTTLSDKNAKLVEALKAADNALRNHACHGGPTVPCTRAAYQCQLECGREAGDALLLVEQALTPEKGK